MSIEYNLSTDLRKATTTADNEWLHQIKKRNVSDISKCAYLRPIIDGKWQCVHSERVAANKSSTKIDLIHRMQLCIEAGNLSYIIANAQKKAVYNIFLFELLI